MCSFLFFWQQSLGSDWIQNCFWFVTLITDGPFKTYSVFFHLQYFNAFHSSISIQLVLHLNMLCPYYIYLFDSFFWMNFKKKCVRVSVCVYVCFTQQLVLLGVLLLVCFFFYTFRAHNFFFIISAQFSSSNKKFIKKKPKVTF